MASGGIVLNSEVVGWGGRWKEAGEVVCVTFVVNSKKGCRISE